MNIKNGVEKPLADLIKAKAESEGLSINKTIKKLLEEYLGVKPQPERKNLRDFEDFCGLWTKDDLDEFEKKTSDLREIDDADGIFGLLIGWRGQRSEIGRQKSE